MIELAIAERIKGRQRSVRVSWTCGVLCTDKRTNPMKSKLAQWGGGGASQFDPQLSSLDRHGAHDRCGIDMAGKVVRRTDSDLKSIFLNR